MSLEDDSLINNEVTENALGQGGGIQITANNLSLSGGSIVQTDTESTGDGGNIDIHVAERTLVTSYRPSDGYTSEIRTYPGKDATGDGGNITLETGKLKITDGGYIIVGTTGEGSSGDIAITVHGDTSISMSRELNGNPQARKQDESLSEFAEAVGWQIDEHGQIELLQTLLGKDSIARVHVANCLT